jgi:hypothetical protein
MEFDSPLKDSDGHTYVILRVNEPLTVIYDVAGVYPTPPETSSDLAMYTARIAKQFEEYSVRWFPTPVFSVYFIKNLEHNWIYTTQPDPSLTKWGTISARQVWSPEMVKSIRGKYQITWTLLSTEYNPVSVLSGQDDGVEIPYCEDSAPVSIQMGLRAHLKKKIRTSRIRAAAAKWKLNELIESYYTKYGSLEGVDKGSELSSEIDSDIEPSAKI